MIQPLPVDLCTAVVGCSSNIIVASYGLSYRCNPQSFWMSGVWNILFCFLDINLPHSAVTACVMLQTSGHFGNMIQHSVTGSSGSQRCYMKVWHAQSVFRFSSVRTRFACIPFPAIVVGIHFWWQRISFTDCCSSFLVFFLFFNCLFEVPSKSGPSTPYSS